MPNEIRLENIKRLQKITNEINLIYQQIKDENVLKHCTMKMHKDLFLFSN
ncbi:hypothetical protein IO476_001751 [Campylobacter coli]|nr:hypothetical protein [Campylobacter coli]